MLAVQGTAWAPWCQLYTAEQAARQVEQMEKGASGHLGLCSPASFLLCCHDAAASLIS